MEIESDANHRVRFRFDEFVEIPSGGSTFAGSYHFLSADVAGFSTSNPVQRLKADLIDPSDFPLPASEPDAVLRTVSDAPPTSALQVHHVRLFLGGFRARDWAVRFETPVHAFNLDGRWLKV
ncbi:hypothetical protein [Streptomyces sp. WG5]|uniref:hypothetical protein n=1 Tax=Streptomyces sp. WG5 TaxID=3417648 RepID=UPI003CEC1FB3